MKEENMKIGLLEKSKFCKCYSRHFLTCKQATLKEPSLLSQFVLHKVNAIGNCFLSFFPLFENIDLVSINYCMNALFQWNEFKWNEMIDKT